MPVTELSFVYDELLDVLAEGADVTRLLSFRLSPDKQARLDDLLDKNRVGQLAADETAELDDYERLEHLVRLLKARARQKRRP
jgi:hypothetical protein